MPICLNRKISRKPISYDYDVIVLLIGFHSGICCGELAQTVERPLCMREVPGSYLLIILICRKPRVEVQVDCSTVFKKTLFDCCFVILPKQMSKDLITLLNYLEVVVLVS